MKIARPLLILASCLAFSAAAAFAYDINKATQAAGKALEKVRHNTEFYFYNIPPDQKPKPEVILKFMRDCRAAGQAGAIGSEKLSVIFDVLQAALAAKSEEKFDGLVLIVVAAQKDPKKFDALLLSRGITPVYATY